MLFSYYVLLHHFLLIHLYHSVYAIVFLFKKYLNIFQNVFYTACYYKVPSSFQMSNKFINFESWVNIYGLPLFWCSSWQIVVMLFCFEEALFMYSKNVWNFPRRISFVNRSDIFLWLNFSFSASYCLFWLYYELLCCSCLAFKAKPRHVDESSYIGRNSYCFHKIVISI